MNDVSFMGLAVLKEEGSSYNPDPMAIKGSSATVPQSDDPDIVEHRTPYPRIDLWGPKAVVSSTEALPRNVSTAYSDKVWEAVVEVSRT